MGKRRQDDVSDPALVRGIFGPLYLCTAAPEIPVPVPEIFIGRGTFYRIGGDRAVEVKAGDVTKRTVDRGPETDYKRSFASGRRSAVAGLGIGAKRGLHDDPRRRAREKIRQASP